MNNEESGVKIKCVDCRYFHGYDGVGELWTGCSFGDFKGIRTHCSNFRRVVSKSDLLRKIHSLENEVERQRNEIKLLQKQLSKIPPKVREVWLYE